jgi:hypothetical protein
VTKAVFSFEFSVKSNRAFSENSKLKTAFDGSPHPLRAPKKIGTQK